MIDFIKLTLLLGVLTDFNHINTLADKYEVQDSDSNQKWDLIKLLQDRTESEKENKKDYAVDSNDDWTGRWLPSRPGEYVPPPKVFHQNSQIHQFENEPLPQHFSSVENNLVNGSHDANIPMGVQNINCDDGKTNLTTDWDGSADSYTCYGQKIVPSLNLQPELYCEIIPKHYRAMHKCMWDKIEYKADIPLYGTHRPIWPVYGEYKYVPKQRWLHSLEHGAVVMLYHPCANSLEVKKLKSIVKSCLRRYIITPYSLLDQDMPLALLTWGCRLTMSHVNRNEVETFIRENALQSPENQIYRDGDFNDQLTEKAKVVSDEKDSYICTKPM